MQGQKLWQRLARKNVNTERLVAILSVLGADTAPVRFGSAKVLKIARFVRRSLTG